MKHKIILEIKKLASEIEQSNSFNTAHYKEMLKNLHDKFVVLEYLEKNIQGLIDESVEDHIEFGDIKEERKVEDIKSVEEKSLEEEVVADKVEEIEPVDDRLEKLRALEETIDAVGNKEVKKSLNEELKKNVVNIGLNDRIAFVKILFDGNQQDFNRVLSQVNSFNTIDELRDFIDNYVKPDHNWDEYEEYSQRFIEIIESKFE